MLIYVKFGKEVFMKRFRSLCVVMFFLMAAMMFLPVNAYADGGAGTIENKVKVLMEYSDGTTVPVPETEVGIVGGLLDTKFLLGSEYYICDDEGKVNFRQTSRITDMRFKLPAKWQDKVNTEEARAEYNAKLMGTFRYYDYKADIKNNRFRVGMPLAWTTVDTTIYLKAGKFKVNFTGEGITDFTNEVEYLKTVKEPAVPSREGYTFKGWYNGNEAFKFSNPITDDIELKTVWEKNIYTVTFRDNGEDIIKVERVVHGEKVKQPADIEREGYIFKGWYKGWEKFDFDTQITKNITLNARLEAIQYRVKFNSAGGKSVPEEWVLHGDKVTEPKTKRLGYKFIGWFKGSEKFDFNTSIKENITLTAKWEVIKFTVTFKDEGKILEEKIVKYGRKVEKPNNPEKEGYKFVGWYRYGEPFDFDSEIFENITLIAEWEEDTKFASKPVSFYVYNRISKGKMSLRAMYFVSLDKTGAYISNADKLKWDTLGWPIKYYYVNKNDIDKSSKLYNEDGTELNVKNLINTEWINTNMNEKYKNRNSELRVYRLTKANDEPIHVDLALYDLDKNKWVHELD